MGSGVSAEGCHRDPTQRTLVAALADRGLNVSVAELDRLKELAIGMLDLAMEDGEFGAKACLQIISLDPLNGLKPAKICDMLHEEVIEAFEVSSEEDARIQSGEGFEANRAVKLALMDTALLETLSRDLRQRVVSLDLSNCSISAIPTKMPFVRELVLSGCGFDSAVNFQWMPFLLVLDMSYVDLSGADGMLSNICSMSTLIKLSLDGCCLTEMPSLQRLRNLTFLSLRENEITSFGDASHPVLEAIDLRENEGFQSKDGRPGGVLREAQERFPLVKLVNNQIVNTNAKVVKYGEIEGLRDEFARTDTVADENEDRGSCSCIEGEPCAVEYTCKDWANRFKIAEYARQSSK